MTRFILLHSLTCRNQIKFIKFLLLANFAQKKFMIFSAVLPTMFNLQLVHLMYVILLYYDFPYFETLFYEARTSIAKSTSRKSFYIWCCSRLCAYKKSRWDKFTYRFSNFWYFKSIIKIQNLQCTNFHRLLDHTHKKKLS